MVEPEVLPGLFLVTGATGGIGQAVCRRLAKKGFFPVVGHRDGKYSEAAKIADECSGIPLELDMDDTSSINNAVSFLSNNEHKLNGIVLAASPPPRLKPFSRISGEDMDSFMRVNVVGPQILLARLVKTCFQEQKKGTVTGILSAAMGTESEKTMPEMGAYTISKFGLMGVLKLLAAEYPWLDVRYIYPGFTQTPMLDAFDPRLIEILQKSALFATPDEVAKIIVDDLT